MKAIYGNIYISEDNVCKCVQKLKDSVQALDDAPQLGLEHTTSLLILQGSRMLNWKKSASHFELPVCIIAIGCWISP
jgi:hypothetical protein